MCEPGPIKAFSEETAKALEKAECPELEKALELAYSSLVPAGLCHTCMKSFEIDGEYEDEICPICGETLEYTMLNRNTIE